MRIFLLLCAILLVLVIAVVFGVAFLVLKRNSQHPASPVNNPPTITLRPLARS
jgi:hypothetical protein